MKTSVYNRLKASKTDNLNM